jgi:nucleoside-diphosphate-sugar epimerase
VTAIGPVWVVGCGDVGCRIVRRYAARGVAPHALAKSEASVDHCSRLGARAVRFDLDAPDDGPTLEVDDGRVIYLAPPPAEGTNDPRIRDFLARYGERIRRIVLISTTGVYGDCGGEWIDEDKRPEPNTDRGRRRLDAENAVADWSRGGGGFIILRVGGIYAGDRLPVERLRRGLPVVRESESAFTNRIHAEDLADICVTALESAKTSLVLNATDGHPTTMTDYFNRVADAVGLERPAQITLAQARQALSPGMLSYVLESRRIDNRRLLDELGVVLRYPNLESTLSEVRVGGPATG